MTAPARACPTCGEIFFRYVRKRDAGNAAYCSRRCYNESNPSRAAHPPIARTCTQCGKTFVRPVREQETGKPVFCSRRCYGNSRRQALRTCLACGTVFRFRSSAHARGLYCSLSCKGAAQRTRPVVPCERCGAMFTARLNRQGVRTRFCSRECANKTLRNGVIAQAYRWDRKHEWSVNHPCCTSCKTTTTPHVARGLCKLCYNRDRFRRLYVPKPRAYTPKETFTELPRVWPYVADSVQLSDTDIVVVVNRAVPTNLDDEVRAETCQALILAILEGKVSIADLARMVPTFINRAHRVQREFFRAVSLSSPVWVDKGVFGNADV